MKRVSLLFGFWLCFLIATQPAVTSNPAIVGEIQAAEIKMFLPLPNISLNTCNPKESMRPKSWSLGTFLRWVPFGLVF